MKLKYINYAKEKWDYGTNYYTLIKLGNYAICLILNPDKKENNKEGSNRIADHIPKSWGKVMTKNEVDEVRWS